MTKTYSIQEEWVNSLTHALGVVLGITGLVLLLVFSSSDPWKIVSFSIYGSSIILLFLASTLYHAFQKPSLKLKLKVLDHAMIYVLIAGTYTPFLLVNLRESGWGWALFGVIWGLALAGLFFKLFYVNRFKSFSIAVYLAMGWLIIIAIKPMLDYVGFSGLMWLLAGGLCYSIGVIFYVWEKLPHHHGIWHLMVLAGCICHFFAVFLYVRPA